MARYNLETDWDVSVGGKAELGKRDDLVFQATSGHWFNEDGDLDRLQFSAIYKFECSTSRERSQS